MGPSVPLVLILELQHIERPLRVYVYSYDFEYVRRLYTWRACTHADRYTARFGKSFSFPIVTGAERDC